MQVLYVMVVAVIGRKGLVALGGYQSLLQVVLRLVVAVLVLFIKGLISCCVLITWIRVI